MKANKLFEAEGYKLVKDTPSETIYRINIVVEGKYTSGHVDIILNKFQKTYGCKNYTSKNINQYGGGLTPGVNKAILKLFKELGGNKKMKLKGEK